MGQFASVEIDFNLGVIAKDTMYTAHLRAEMNIVIEQVSIKILS